MAKKSLIAALGLALGAIGASAEGVAEKPLDYQTYQSGKETTIAAESVPTAARQPKKIATRVFPSERPGYEGVNISYDFYDDFTFCEQKDSSTKFSLRSFYDADSNNEWGLMEENMVKAGVPMYMGNNFDKVLREVYSDYLVQLETAFSAERNAYEAQIIKLNGQLIETSLSPSKISELEQSVKDSEAKYASAKAEAENYSQRLLALQEEISNTETEQTASTAQPSADASENYGVPYTAFVQPHPSAPTQSSQSTQPQTGVLSLEEIKAAYSASMLYPVNSSSQSSQPVLTDEQRLEALARGGPRSENTMNLEGSSSQPTADNASPTTESGVVNVAVSQEEAERIYGNTHSRVYSPNQKKKIELPVGITIDVLAGPGILGVRRDKNEKLTSDGTTGYVGGKIGVNMQTKNPNLSLGVTLNGAYGFKEIVDSYEGEPRASGRRNIGSVTNESFVKAALGLELLGKYAYVGTAIGAWINGQNTYEADVNADGLVLKEDTDLRIKASPSFDIYAGLKLGPARVLVGWESRKGGYIGTGIQIGPTKNKAIPVYSN